MELNHLRDTGFLDVNKILYTKLGLYQAPRELEDQLVKQIENGKSKQPNSYRGVKPY
jgi:hypothetical protein